VKNLRRWATSGGLALGLIVGPLATMAGATASATAPTEISVGNSAFGKILVVGNGQFAGYTVYYLTSDNPPNYGCTTVVHQLPVGPIACTGPEGSQSAEWPAVTTSGSPIAGKGVKQSLLGEVFRSDLNADQVTYAGHPLYLFDMSADQVTGEGFDEPGLPPWHGLWWVLSPKGTAVPWPENFTTTTIDGKTVLAAEMQTLAGWIAFPVYRDSKSACTGACARTWPAVITAGTPGVSAGLDAGAFGTKTIAGGLHQVTYHGQPLYLYGDETPTLSSTGKITLFGTGNGKKDAGGTFRLISA
jgi:predicted lipoprotein with Yx(FWY)xxD motif